MGIGYTCVCVTSEHKSVGVGTIQLISNLDVTENVSVRGMKKMWYLASYIYVYGYEWYDSNT